VLIVERVFCILVVFFIGFACGSRCKGNHRYADQVRPVDHFKGRE
jgi:hypothetical protein